MKLQMKRPATRAVRALLVAAGLLLAAPAVLAAPGDGYWSTRGKDIVDASGNVVHITGANWFGFETDNKMPHGLWSVNYRSFLDKVKSMGITVIRLPYSDDIMANGPVQSLNTYVNPELTGVTTLTLMDAIVEYCGQLGIRIILDRHRPSSAGQSALWYTASVSEATWLRNMQTLATRYKGNPTVVGFDLHNEPHAEGTMPAGTGACWGCSDVNRDWRRAAERGGNAVHQANPDLLILVEGVSCPAGGTPNYWDNEPDEQCGWWGGNLSKVTDPAMRVNLSKPNKLVYSPHDYGMSVHQQSWFLDPAFPATLEPYWDGMWGFIAKQGIAPVLIGEFGSTLADPKDKVWLDRLLAYANRNGMSWTYWCLNPNSGDTKGLFLDDWTTIDNERYSVIKPYLTPLASGGGGPTFYSLVVTKDGTGTGTVAGGGINCGTACSGSFESGTTVTLTAAAAAGSTFTAWGGDCTGSNATCILSMTASRSVTATFAAQQQLTYVLTVTKPGTGAGTVTSSPSGINCGSTCSATYNSGTVVTLTAAATSPSTFGGWSGGVCSGTAATCTVTMSQARSVTATFNPGTNTFALTVTKAGTGTGTVTSSPSGINCGSTCSASYTSGTVVTLTAAAATGSAFAGWSNGCSGMTTTCVVTLSQARSPTATFNANPILYTLSVTPAGTGSGTVTSSPAGVSCGTTCSAQFGSASVVTLTATPASGSAFAGWGGACTGTAATCTVTMTGAQSVTATFNASGTTPCANPITIAENGQSGPLGAGAACLRTLKSVQGWICSEMGTRTVTINASATPVASCGGGLPKHTDGYTYFSVSAGSPSWASIAIW